MYNRRLIGKIIFSVHVVSSRTELRWLRVFACHGMPISNRETGFCDTVIKGKKWFDYAQPRIQH